MSKKLVMHFLDNANKDVSLSISDIKENLTQAEISKVMDLIIQKSIFNTSIDMVKKSRADIVDTETQEFKF